VRDGYAVRIRSGSEVWVPSLQISRTFPGTKVLVFDIVKGKAPRDRVCVELHGVSKEQWDDFRKMFIRLRELPDASVVRTSQGSLLTDSSLRGDLFVKGVWVARDPKLSAGYDFSHVTVDRDRRNKYCA